jgi:hypothetical protein
MNKVLHIILISIFSISILSCAENSSDGSCSTSTMNDPNNTTPVTFTENVHSSLADAWVAEYNTIKENLLTIFPLYQKYYRGIVVYAWNGNVDDPYSGVTGGAYIGIENNDETMKRFVMEIPNQEFSSNSFHRYSVIVHEYFHCYQQSLNLHMNKSNADPTNLVQNG